MLYLVTAIFAFPMIGGYSFVSATFPYFYNWSCYDKYPILASNCKTLLCFPCIFFIVQWNFLVDELTVCALHSEFLWSLFHTYIYYFQTELNSKHTKQTILDWLSHYSRLWHVTCSASHSPSSTLKFVFWM